VQSAPALLAARQTGVLRGALLDRDRPPSPKVSDVLRAS
jgi:hypothetical protein